jgi:hypothetical protein
MRREASAGPSRLRVEAREARERESQRARIAGLAEELDRAREGRQLLRGLSGEQHRHGKQELRLVEGRRSGIHALGGGTEPGEAFAEKDADRPDPARAAGKLDGDRGFFARPERPIERGANVLDLGEIRAAQEGFGLADVVVGRVGEETLEVRGMAVLERVELAGLVELFHREGTGRFEKAIASGAFECFCHDERTGDELEQHVGHGMTVDRLARGDGGDGLQRETSREDRTAPQHARSRSSRRS